jgi:hypothetical protein
MNYRSAAESRHIQEVYLSGWLVRSLLSSFCSLFRDSVREKEGRNYKKQKNTKHQNTKTLTAAQISRSMRHYENK